MSDDDDAALIRRAVRNDDRAAFAQLVRRHQAAIRSVLRRLTRGDGGLADDLAQETFLRAYTSLARFRGEARFRTWLYRIAVNRFLEHRRGAQTSIDRHAEALTDPDEISCEDSNPIDAMSTIDRALDVTRAMARLSPSEREAIICCYYADLSHREAAAALGCPLGTVKTNVLRGREKLRAALLPWGETMPKEKIHG